MPIFTTSSITYILYLSSQDKKHPAELLGIFYFSRLRGLEDIRTRLMGAKNNSAFSLVRSW